MDVGAKLHNILPGLAFPSKRLINLQFDESWGRQLTSPHPIKISDTCRIRKKYV
jgi:hypothetical protein